VQTSDPIAEWVAAVSDPDQSDPGRGKGGLWARILGVFAEVRPGEAGTALLLGLEVFILLTAYYLIKPAREGLILSLAEGAEYKSYSSAAIAALLLVAVPLYGKVTKRFARNRLIVAVTLFFALDLVGFWALDALPGSRDWLGIPFYLWVGIFNMMVVAQFWAFANDIYSVEAGKRLFPLIGLGASIGAATGSRIASWALQFLEVTELLLVAAALLVIAAALVEWVHRRALAAPAAPAEPAEPEEEKSPSRTSNGLVMVLRDRYLLQMALFSLVFTFVNTNGEYVLSVLMSEAAEAAEAAGELGGVTAEAYIGQMYGRFYFWVNVLGVALQAFLVSRLVKWGGIRLALLFLPVLALGTWSLVVAVPVLGVVWASKTLENASDYSINNTARQMLWLPLPSDVKYNAKQAVDTVCVRLGDVASAVLVFAIADSLELSLRTFAIVTLGLVVVWLVLAARLVREHRRRAREREQAG
jgi:ATP:ADP antiporter, AAA family